MCACIAIIVAVYLLYPNVFALLVYVVIWYEDLLGQA